MLLSAGLGTTGCSSTKKALSSIEQQQAALQSEIDQLGNKEVADSALLVQKIKDAEKHDALRVVMGDALLFPLNSYTLSAASDAALSKIAYNLNQFPNTYITVVGFTDNTGTDAINNKLSAERAESVANYLVNHGVKKSRLTTMGDGSKHPIASNATPAGRAQNRRVEIYVTSSPQTVNSLDDLVAGL